VIGRRDRLSPQLLEAVELAECGTAGNEGLFLRIALDYSGRDSILAAARLLQRRGVTPTREVFSQLLGEITNDGRPSPNIDVLIRTGGEQRLSDFMLWESAYAEMIFTDCLWPDFGAADLETAIEEYFRRDRRFGRIPATSSAVP
jgi:undecaprenyl diphosphate synthase